jgi:fission process protein 1
MGSSEQEQQNSMRYFGYAARLRNFVTGSSRYLAYTSDVGEAFRPVVHPFLVKGAYGISFAYVGYDVGMEWYHSKQRKETTEQTTRTVIQRTIFQGFASLLLPAITIHTIVDQSAKQFKKSSNQSLRRFGPTTMGLMVVPLLPIMYDEPLEHVMDKVFDIIWPIDKKQ